MPTLTTEGDYIKNISHFIQKQQRERKGEKEKKPTAKAITKGNCKALFATHKRKRLRVS